MSKEFGYPKFINNEKILTTYDNEYSNMLMDIRVYKVEKNQIKIIKKENEETAILLLSGTLRIEHDNKTEIIKRKNVFTEGLWCLHICKDIEVKITGMSNSEFLVQSTYNEKIFDSKLYGPKDAPWIYSAVGKYGNVAKRRVSTVFDYKIAPYSNMVIGEVLNDRGNWSGYIPHQHPQPETYYYMFDKEEGFGAAFVGDNVYKIKDGSFSAIPGGKTHPQASAPGFQMYTCWMIRHLDGNPWVDRIDDPRYTWLDEL